VKKNLFYGIVLALFFVGCGEGSSSSKVAGSDNGPSMSAPATNDIAESSEASGFVGSGKKGSDSAAF